MLINFEKGYIFAALNYQQNLFNNKKERKKEMAKFYGGYVKSGKLGSSVFAISKGVTVERQYQPKVFNPQTKAQVQQRAKFKLLSGLASVVSPFACLLTEGLQTQANAFVKRNMQFVSFSNETARINMPNIQISGGSNSFVTPTLTIAQGTGTGSISAEDVRAAGYDGVVFLVVGTKRPSVARITGKVVLAPSENAYSIQFSVPGSFQEYHLYAYGIKLTDKGVSTYGSLDSISESVVEVSVTRMISEGMMTASATSYVFARS